MWFKKKKEEIKYYIVVYMTYPRRHYIEDIPTKEEAEELLEKIRKAKRGIEFPDCFIKADEIKGAEIFHKKV